MGIFHVGLNHFLGLSALLFGLGVYGIVTRKNELSWLIGVLLLFSSVNISFVAFSRYQIAGLEGQIFPVFIIIVVSAQIAIAAALTLRHYKNKGTEKI